MQQIALVMIFKAPSVGWYLWLSKSGVVQKSVVWHTGSSFCACLPSAVACVGGGYLHNERQWYLSYFLEQKHSPQAITRCFVLVVNFPQDQVPWKGRTISQMLIIWLHVFEHNTASDRIDSIPLSSIWWCYFRYTVQGKQQEEKHSSVMSLSSDLQSWLICVTES